MLLRHCSLRNGSCFKTSLYYRRAFGSLRSTPETFTRLATNSSSKHQIYISKADDPFLNLSIEHYLLQNSPANSTVLFLYINRPCIVIGRNQNPWLEANLNALRKTDLVGQPLGGLTGSNHFTTSSPIALLRRRSGGGTVFHDHGNVNYSVICPTHVFSRDKHAEMVVRAIRKDNLRARVTERHDIVLDQGDLLPQHEMPPGSDTHRSNYHSNIALKVSGSAYKLTRNRSLHHGTCLINSLNVGNISRILRSPASPFIKARGVDSVRSPVGNVYTRDTMGSVTRFQGNVIEAYTELYGLDKEVNSFLGHEASGTSLTENGGVTYGFLGDDLALVDKIQSGIRELTVCMLNFAIGHRDG